MKSIIAMLGKDYLLEMETDPQYEDTIVRVRSVLTKESFSEKIGMYEAVNTPGILELTVLKLLQKHKEVYEEVDHG